MTTAPFSASIDLDILVATGAWLAGQLRKETASRETPLGQHGRFYHAASRIRPAIHSAAIGRLDSGTAPDRFTCGRHHGAHNHGHSLRTRGRAEPACAIKFGKAVQRRPERLRRGLYIGAERRHHFGQRIETAKGLLSASRKSIKTISYEVGYDDASFFARLFRQHTELSPNQYRQQFQQAA